MNLRKSYKIALFLLSSIAFILLFSNISLIYARRMTPTGVIRGSVRVNICGDYIAEGSEHCDRNDLRGQTCKTLGFDEGTLECNLVCEFDMSECVYTPIPPEEEAEEEDSDIEETEQTEAPEIEERRDQALEEFIRKYVPRVTVESPSQTQLPSAVQFLRLFDANDNGIIESNELPTVVLNWVNSWKYGSKTGTDIRLSCDLNNDNVCDLRDFSILMSYIDTTIDIDTMFDY